MPDEGIPKRRLRVRWPRNGQTKAEGSVPAPTSTASRPLRNPLRAQFEQRSLFGEILDWMLAPLLLLWPMSVTVTYIVAQSIANVPFDRGLADAVGVLSNHLQESRGTVTLQLPISTRELLRPTRPTASTTWCSVCAGNSSPVTTTCHCPRRTCAPLRSKSSCVRISCAATSPHRLHVGRVRRGAPHEYALVQVAETLEKRSQLANEIIRGVIVPQFVVLPIAVVLVWFGLSRGLAPLADLQQRIRSRQTDDLSPIDARGAPEEIAPLVSSFNELLARLSQNMKCSSASWRMHAHQMKTPLAGLRTQAELAVRETDPQELQRTLRHIAVSTERATHLINQLLALARAEYQGSDDSRFEVVDLVTLARDLVRESVSRPSLDTSTSDLRSRSARARCRCACWRASC